MVENAVCYSKVSKIEEDGFEDVYCLSVPETGCFFANGMLIKNCDALRYVIKTHKVQTYDPYKKQPDHNAPIVFSNSYNSIFPSFRGNY